MALVLSNSKPPMETFQRSEIALVAGRKEGDAVKAAIEKTVGEGLTTLRLTDFDELEELPDEVGSLSKLYKISIDNNYVLQRLPATIGYLAERLEILDLSYNSLEDLPLELCSLRYLQRLNCSNNRLRCVPTEIDRLASLEELCLDNNYITAFPPNLGYTKKLQKFYISNNPLVDEDSTPYTPFHPPSVTECDLCKAQLDDEPLLVMNFIDICTNKSVPIAYFLCRYCAVTLHPPLCALSLTLETHSKRCEAIVHELRDSEQTNYGILQYNED